MTIQTLIQAHRARRDVGAALRPLTGTPVHVECAEGHPVRVVYPLPPEATAFSAQDAAEEAAGRLAAWGDWQPQVEHAHRRVVLRRLHDWPARPLMLVPDETLDRSSTPVIGYRRTPDGLSPVRWHSARSRLLSVTGGHGKTVLARAVAEQWYGDLIVLGRYDEWDARRYYRVLPRLSEALEALEALDSLDESRRAEPVLVVVDGLDDHVVCGAAEGQVARLHASLRRLTHVPAVRLLVASHREVDTLPNLDLRLHAVDGSARGRMTLRAASEEIEVQVPWVGAAQKEGVSA